MNSLKPAPAERRAVVNGLHVEIEAGDGQHVVHVIGELDLATVRVLFDGAACLAASGCVADGTATIDLQRLTFVDARGLRALLTLRQQGFRLVGANAAVRRVFDLAQVGFVPADGRPRSERPSDRVRSLEQQAQRHELVAQRFELLGEPQRARQHRELASACHAEANGLRLRGR